MKTNLQNIRKNAGFRSARAFSEHIGMPVATYTDYEQGRRSFTLEKACEFADELHCTLDELAGREFHPPGEVVSDPFERELVGQMAELPNPGIMAIPGGFAIAA